MTHIENIQELFRKYLENRCTPEESRQVLDWLGEDAYNDEHKDVINHLLANTSTGNIRDAGELKQHLNRNLQAILQKIEIAEANNANSSNVRSIKWLRWAAAAIFIVAFAGTGIYFLLSQPSAKNIVTANNTKSADITPGGNKAVLVLSDGQKLVLESADNGNLTQQGNSAVVKDGNKLTYNPTGNSANSIIYNSIITPKGGQYQLTLADGSKVWLNSASSIRFPVAFSGSERKVEITGEAYFEVAKSKAKPFVVSFTTPGGKKSDVTVLGTQFDIMAYEDEDAAKTTLVEGSVKISSNGNTALLSPRQQANLKGDGVKVVDNVNTDEVTAWKDGYFQFDAAGFQYVMRQISRWYDVNIVYEGAIPNRKFGGKISRDNNLSEVLKILKATNVKFRLENKTIIVTQ